MMFLNSSPKSIRSKIIQAAIEVDNEYRRYKTANTRMQDTELAPPKLQLGS
jgi:hypothetical protein